ncbi:MAG: zinc-binding dehydrogenase [Gammaproteobacteria bacterium]|nr:zinc-binding dehydrogenase [Gammaproteobacteria bacterium]
MTFTCDAMVMREPGAPDVLERRTIELSWPGKPDEVLVKLEAAGINPADTFFRALGPYIGDGVGATLGHDGAGVVEAVGEAVTEFSVGDRVAFCNGGVGGDPGTYASHAVVPEWLLARVPDNVDMVQAAALPLVFITIWESFVERARLQAGETVLVHAGAGGTGHLAIQVARQLGATVATTVSSEKKSAFAAALGAEKTINYRKEDFVTATRQWTRDKGVDVALDNIGPEGFQATLGTLAPYGRIVTLMGSPGDVDETAYNANLSIHNVMMLTPMWLGLDDYRRNQGAITRRAMEWLGESRIKVEIAATYPLDQVADAHTRLEAGGNMGKIVLTLAGEK